MKKTYYDTMTFRKRATLVRRGKAHWQVEYEVRKSLRFELTGKELFSNERDARKAMRLYLHTSRLGK